LQGANLEGTRTRLEGTSFAGAHLHGANLSGAQLQGANLERAHLQGANLQLARLHFADLSSTDLRGANLIGAELQGASLWGARLQGANLGAARLQGANLDGAELQGASLGGAFIYGSRITPSTKLVDVRATKWNPLSTGDVLRLQASQSTWLVPDDKRWREVNSALQAAAKPGLTPPQILACVWDAGTRVSCRHSYSMDEFGKLFLPELEKLACQSPYIAHGVIHSNHRYGSRSLALHLVNKLKINRSEGLCPGLASLSAEDKALLTELARKDEAQQREGSRTSAQPNTDRKR
jgi:hypothetical protein